MMPFTIPGHPGQGNRITAAIYIIIHKLISMFVKDTMFAQRWANISSTPV